MMVYVNTRSKKSRKQKQKVQAVRSQQRQIAGQKTFKVLSRKQELPVRLGSMDYITAPSLGVSGKMDPASELRAPNKVYTGTEMIGIAVMHKSNLVPVFSKAEAIDSATMRRG